MNESLVADATDQIVRRIYGEYLEMPGLRLTCAQAQRLWALDEHTCDRLFEILTEDGFLYRRDDGTYARRTDGAAVFPPVRMVKAERTAASPSSPRAAVSSRK